MVDQLPDRGDEVEPTPRTQSESEDDDLAVSLSALSRLSAVRLSLEDLLTEVATFAVQATPGADGAGLTLIEANRADTIVKSAPFVREIDDIQYGLGEGLVSVPPPGGYRCGPGHWAVTPLAAVRPAGRPTGGAQRAVAAADQRQRWSAR
ncbi:MAG TPA: hypothetical protein VII33_14280 [Nakamurella sp.]